MNSFKKAQANTYRRPETKEEKEEAALANGAKAFKWLMLSGQAHLDNFPIISSTVPYNIPRNKSKISCAQSQKSGKAYIPGIGNLGSHIRILPTVVRLFRREQK